MDPLSILLFTLLFMVLLILSAFFSGSEVAIFGLSRLDEEILKDRNDIAAQRLKKLLLTPQQTLITILIGNNAVNVSAASIAAIITAHICKVNQISHEFGIIIEIIVVTILLLLLGEITPKVLVLRNPLNIALKVSSFIHLCRTILYPLVSVFTIVTDFLTRIVGAERLKLTYSAEELKSLVEISEEKGHLEESEREMITSIFEFGDTLVKEIMVPRTDMKVLEHSAPLTELLASIKEWGYSRYPVYDDSRDNIVGMLYAKDLLHYVQSPSESFNITQIIRPAYFVPENKEISELLREFQIHKVHLAIVVDEYGGTAGLVTLEDILEEIVGEIQDEYDQESPPYTIDDSGVIVADALMTIEDVNSLFKEDIIPEDGDFETLGGFIYDRIGKIPGLDEGVEFARKRFTVEELDGQRIKKVRIENIEPNN